MTPASLAPSRASPSFSGWKASAHLTKPLARLSAREIYIINLSKKLRHLKMVSISKLTRKFANHEKMYRQIFLNQRFLFSEYYFRN
jgi:hypothetical protein